MEYLPLNFEMSCVQYLNYVAVALLHLAGHHAPSEREIRHVEADLDLIFKRLANNKLYATREIQSREGDSLH